MNRIVSVSLLIVMVLLFQNFKFASVDLVNYQVNEVTRSEHARELLGKKYKRSKASKMDKEVSLNNEIYNFVELNLPKKYEKKSERITKAILEEADYYDIDPVFLVSIIKTESSFNPVAIGTSGEIGLMQLMPGTGEFIAKKIKMKYHGARTLRDPVKNIKLGAAYFNYLREKFDNKAYRYLPAYNVGPGKITRVENRKDLPKIYSDKVLKHYESFYKKIYVTQVKKEPELAINN